MKWLRGWPHYTPAILAFIIAWECQSIINMLIWCGVCAGCIMMGHKVSRKSEAK